MQYRRPCRTLHDRHGERRLDDNRGLLGAAKRSAAPLRRGFAGGDETAVSRATIAFGPFHAHHELVEYQPATQRGSESTTVEAAILSEGFISRYAATVDYRQHAIWMSPISHPYVRPFNRSGIEADKETNGAFVIWRIIPDSPASQAGLRAISPAQTLVT